MKNLILRFTLILAAFFSFTACSKDEPTPQTKTEMLTSKAWSIVKVKKNGIDISKSREGAYISVTQPKFNIDGSYRIDLAGFEGYYTTGSWYFNDDESVITFAPYMEDEFMWEIMELKKGTLKVRQNTYYEHVDGEKEPVLFEFELININ